MQDAGGQDTVPVAARKALADMKDFLPYKGYRLLDTQWVLASTSGPAITRLRGVDEQEYELELRASADVARRPAALAPSTTFVRFVLRSRATGPAGGSGEGGRTRCTEGAREGGYGRAEIGREIFQLERERDDLQLRISKGRKDVEVGMANPDEVKRLEVQLAAVTRRIAGSEAVALRRVVEGERPRGHRHLLPDGRRRDRRRRHLEGERRRQGADRAAHRDRRTARRARRSSRRYNRQRADASGRSTSGAPSTLQVPRADPPDHGEARGTASERRHRAALPHAVRAAGRDDPVGAVHRRAREPGHAGAVQALPRRPGAGAGDHHRARAADPVDRFLPREIQLAGRHGGRGGRAPSRRDSRARWTRWSSCPASAARPPTSCSATRSACPACRSIATCSASPTASASPRGDDPEVVEQQLGAAMPPAKWTVTSDTLILHGRRICKPRPLCEHCAVRDDCDYYQHGPVAVRAVGPRSAVRAKPRGPRSAVREEAEPVMSAPSMTREALHPARRRSAARHPAPLPRRDEERRRRRRGRAAAALLAELEVEPGDTLFGLYQGTPLPERSWGYGNTLPDRISIYQRPIVEACDRRRRDPRLRRRDRHPRVRPLLRDERGGDRGDRGEVLARRVARRRLSSAQPSCCTARMAADAREAIRPALPRSRRGPTSWWRRSSRSADDRFLEIGPGPGALTLRLAPRVAHLTAVEIDRDLVAALAPRLPANVDAGRADFLDADLASAARGRGPLRVAGNLPYNISSPILFRLLEQRTGVDRDASTDATLMLQREVAERIEAAPGHRRLRRAVDLGPAARRRPAAADAAARRVPARPEGPLGGRPADVPAAGRRAPRTSVSSRRWCGRCSRSGGRRWRTRWRRSPTSRGLDARGGARGRRHRSQRGDPRRCNSHELARLADRFAARARAGELVDFLALPAILRAIVLRELRSARPSGRPETRVNPRLPAAARPAHPPGWRRLVSVFQISRPDLLAGIHCCLRDRRMLLTNESC